MFSLFSQCVSLRRDEGRDRALQPGALRGEQPPTGEGGEGDPGDQGGRHRHH